MLALLLASGPALANTTLSTFENVKVNRVYDGDTIFVDLNCSEDILCKNLGIRLDGIDTPEIRTKNACEKEKALIAKEYVEDKIKAAKRIDIIGAERGKYYRIVGDVMVDGASLSKGLLQNNMAVKYDGGKKETVNWCEN